MQHNVLVSGRAGISIQHNGSISAFIAGGDIWMRSAAIWGEESQPLPCMYGRRLPC